MKTKNFIFAAFLLILGVSRLFAGDPPAPVQVDLSTTTVKELKAKLGDKLIVSEGVALNADDAMVIRAQVANPCDAFPDFEKCGPARAQAAIAARAYANSCCCEVFYSWECCDPSSGPVEYLAIMSPNNCN